MAKNASGRTRRSKGAHAPNMAATRPALRSGPLRSPQEPLPLALPVPDGFIAAVAERVAHLLAERESDTGFVDVEGAAAYLACPRSRIYALVSKRKIPHYKDGSRLLFDRAELRAWVERGGATR